MKKNKNEANKILKIFQKIFIVAIFLCGIAGTIFVVNKNYVTDEITDKTNLIINNSNVTGSLKKDVFIENNTVYISKQDISNFFDNSIIYDEKYNQLITASNTKIATLPIDNNQIEINSSKVRINANAIEKDGEYYVPISQLDNVYNTDTTYVEGTDIVYIDSLDRALSIATVAKNSGIKLKPTSISKTLAKVEQGETITLANRSDYPVPEGWERVRTKDGIIGYLKTNRLGDINNIRDNLDKEKKIEGTISLVWDFYSQYVYAPTRTGKIKGVNVVSPSFFTLSSTETGTIKSNIEQQGQNYITWAKNNKYEIWPMVSNANLSNDETSEIMRDYKLREKVINQIVDFIVQYNLDGINIDFEDMYEADKDYFSRFIIELEPRLNEIGAVLSVDVTAPDGAPNWSLCYDRYTIGKAADYVVFMAYDQYGVSSTESGTTAGLDWVEANITKFLGQEGVAAEKLILGMPFYTLLWKEKDGKLVEGPDVVNIKSVDNVIPEGVEKVWNDSLKQNYVEYSKNGYTYKMWIEDEKSMDERLNLVSKYNLAGASYWAKDREQDSIWNLISSKLGIN